MIEVQVPWRPHAKQRPRVTKRGTFTPKATREAEARIRDAFLDVVGSDFEMFTDSVRVEIELANKHFNLRIIPISDYENRGLRGDADNYMKTIGDALNGVAWEDDKLIVELEVKKL